MTVATKVIEVIHDEDPKVVINRDLKGWIEKVEPLGHDAVVCVYERPQKMKSGLYMPDGASRVAEDKFQGVVGLVVKLGPNFHEKRREIGVIDPIKVGDWVSFRTQDCVAFVLGNRAMRQLEGHFLRQRLADPDCII